MHELNKPREEIPLNQLLILLKTKQKSSNLGSNVEVEEFSTCYSCNLCNQQTWWGTEPAKPRFVLLLDPADGSPKHNLGAWALNQIKCHKSIPVYISIYFHMQTNICNLFVSSKILIIFITLLNIIENVVVV